MPRLAMGQMGIERAGTCPGAGAMSIPSWISPLWEMSSSSLRLRSPPRA